MDGFINFEKFRFDIDMDNGYNNFITEELILSPLYKKIKDFPKSILEMLPIENLKLELYCNKCRNKRIYTFATIGLDYYTIEMGPSFVSNQSSVSIGYEKMMKENQYFYCIAKADCGHNLIILFKIIDENTIMKVGQSPSIYDMNEEINNKTFLRELEKEYASYYKTACSLNSFNSNIGAMTYLRRIFEKLLLDCFDENSSEITLSKEDFTKLKMSEKLDNVRKFLPQIIFENGYNQVYSKVSDGIHNLSEEECAHLFIPLRMAIEEILIEKIELKEKKSRQEKLGKELQNI